MKKLMEQMAEELSAAFEKAGYDPSLRKSNRIQSDRTFANFSATVPWRLPKQYKKAPFMIADDVVANLGRKHYVF